MIPAWTTVRRFPPTCLLLVTMLLSVRAGAQDSDLEWPFPEFTKQQSMKVKAELADAYLKVATEHTRKYALAVFPLEQVGGTLADVEAAATLGEKELKKLETVRATDDRIYLTRGSPGAAWVPFYHDIRTCPAEVVVELDPASSRLVVFYKIDMRLELGSVPHDWTILLTEAARWALAAEGK